MSLSLTQVLPLSHTAGWRIAPMLRERRLKRPRDFAALRSHGRAWSGKLLVLVARPNSLETSRVGLAVGKRVGKAVARNLVKRRLREVVRRIDLQEGWDILLIARNGAGQADFHALDRSLRSLCRRARLVARPSGNKDA